MGISSKIDDIKNWVVGKSKKRVGEATGDPGLEIEGKVQQAKGRHELPQQPAKDVDNSDQL